MISVSSFSAKGVPGDKVKLPESIFGIEASPRLIAQAVRVYLGNQRQSSAKTKTRGEVKKTTAKMYRQKGTGRARHGSYSAPIFVGGGIAHGPDGRQNFKLKMSASQTKLTLFASLSAKAKEGLIVLTGLKDLNKTKDADKLIEKINADRKKILLVLAAGQIGVYKALRNLKNVTVVFANQINTFNVIKHNKLAISNEALEELSKLFIKK